MDSQNNPNNHQESELEKLRRELDKVVTEREEYLNGWKRAKADLINYQKGEDGRAEQFIKYGNERILKDMVTVLDSLGHGIASLKDKKEIDGLKMIKGQLEEILGRYGFKKVEVKIGDKFDPAYHEAISIIEPKDNLTTGVIAQEVSNGYMIYDKVVRATKVIVIK